MNEEVVSWDRLSPDNRESVSDKGESHAILPPCRGSKPE